MVWFPKRQIKNSFQLKHPYLFPIQIEMNYLPGGEMNAFDNENRLNDFKSKVTDMMNGQSLPFTLIMDDPSGKSFLQVISSTMN